MQEDGLPKWWKNTKLRALLLGVAIFFATTAAGTLFIAKQEQPAAITPMYDQIIIPKG